MSSPQRDRWARATDGELSGPIATLQAVAVTSRTVVRSMVGAVAASGALAAALAGVG